MGACNSKAPPKQNGKKPEKPKNDQDDTANRDDINQDQNQLDNDKLEQSDHKNDNSAENDKLPLEDMLVYLKNGNFDMFRKVAQSHDIRDASFLRGLDEEFQWTNVASERGTESMKKTWNPVQICLAFAQNDILSNLVDQGALLYQHQLFIEMDSPHIIKTELSYQQFIASECKALEIAVQNKDALALDSVWNKPTESNSFMPWSHAHFEYLLQILNESEFAEGIKLLIQSPTIKSYLNDTSGNLDQLIQLDDKIQAENMTAYQKQLHQLVQTRQTSLLDQVNDNMDVHVDNQIIREVLNQVSSSLLGHSYDASVKLEFTSLHQLMHESYESKNPQKIVEFFQQETSLKKNLNQLFRVSNHAQTDDLFVCRDHFLHKSFVMLWAVQQNHNELIELLLGNQHNFFRVSDLMTLIKAVVENQKDIDSRKQSWSKKCLQTILESPVMKGMFTNLQVHERAQLANWILDLGQLNNKLMPILILCMTNRPYASFLMLYMCNRDTYKLIIDFTNFEKATNNSFKLELEQAPEALYGEQVKQFIDFIMIQQTDSPFYLHGIKVVKMIQSTIHFKDYQYNTNILLDKESMVIEEEVLDLNFKNTLPKLGQTRQFITVHAIEKALKNVNKDFFTQAITTSQQSTHGMLLIEHLFLDFAEGYQVPIGLKQTSVKLEEYNLIQVMIACQFDFELINNCLDQLTFLSQYNQSKKLPQFITLLSLCNNFNKGIQRVLKMVVSCKAPHGQVSDFIVKRFNYQIITLENLTSLFKFLVKNKKQEIIDDLAQSQLVPDVLSNSSYEQIEKYKIIMEELHSKEQNKANFEWTFQQVEAYHSRQQQKVNEASLRQVSDVLKQGQVDDKQKFMEQLKVCMQGLQADASYDARIRFNFDQAIKTDEIKNLIIKQNQVGLLILSIIYSNLDAVKILLDVDSKICLRNALQGHIPSVEQSRIDVKKFTWKYKQTSSVEELYLEFDSLGLALLADCKDFPESRKEKHHAILVQFLKHPGFVITQRDFESFIKSCILNKNRMMLRTFLQSFEMQVIFASLSYKKKLEIMQQFVIDSSFEPNVVLRQPYALYCLSHLLKTPNQVKNNSQVAKELLTNIPDERLQLLIQLDPVLVDNVIEAIDLDTFKCNDQNALEQIKRIVNRIKQEELQNKKLSKVHHARINTKVNEIITIQQDENRDSAIMAYEQSLPPVKNDNESEMDL